MIKADWPPDRYPQPLPRCRHSRARHGRHPPGGSIAQSFRIQRKRGFPLPDFDLTDSQRVVVTVTGKVLDENYTRALLAKTDLDLADVIALD